MVIRDAVEKLEARLPVGTAHRLLLHAFDRDDLEQLLRTSLDPPRVLEHYSPDSDNWRKCLLRVLDSADREGWLTDLLVAAKDARTNRQGFGASVDKLLQRVERSPADAGDGRSRYVRLNLLMILVLAMLVSLWSLLVLGWQPFWSVLAGLGVIGAGGLTQSTLNLRLLRIFDELFTLAMGLPLTSVALALITSGLLLASLSWGSVKADIELTRPLRIHSVSLLPQSLHGGEYRLVRTTFWQPTTLLVSGPGTKDSPLTVLPWRQIKIHPASLTPEPYVIVCPKLLAEFHPTMPVTLTISTSQGNATATVRSYVGQPLLLGPMDRRVKQLRPLGVISQGCLDRLKQADPNLNKQHGIPVRGIRTPVPTSDPLMTLEAGETVEFRFQTVSPASRETTCRRARIEIPLANREGDVSVRKLDFEVVPCD